VNFSSQEQGSACDLVLKQYAKELANGAIITAEESRIRVRLPEVV
jgi:predicted nuclease of predicted toxin-antitoxin system